MFSKLWSSRKPTSTTVDIQRSSSMPTLRTITRSSTRIFGGPKPKSEHAAEHTASSAPSPRRTFNVVLFGETGVGRSSVINLIARKEIATVSSDVNRCTMQYKCYNIPFDDVNFAIYDTICLKEPQMDVNSYLIAIEQAYKLINKLGAAGGVHLFLFCLRAGRITMTTQSNYRLFRECLCYGEVPTALVFTGLEKEVEMEDWWERNKECIEKLGIKSDGHACITAVRNDADDRKFLESQVRIRELLKECASKNDPSYPKTHVWFARFTSGMSGFIKGKEVPKQNQIMKVLTQRCELDKETAGKVAAMMEEGDVGTIKGEDNGSETDTPRPSIDLAGRVTKSDHHPFASGSYGDIYRGIYHSNKGPIDVAIKTIRMYLQHDQQLSRNMKRFRRELAVWQGLNHPNVLPFLGTIMDPSTNPIIPAMVCPLAENGPLTAYLKKNDLTLANRLLLIDNVAHGLQYLHSQEIVHGDLSGSNVLIDDGGTARIADFGLSTLLIRLGGPILATNHHAKGTLRWMAPELFDFSDPSIIPTTQSDVYSFGCIMLQILTGNIPYHYLSNDPQVIGAIVTGKKPARPDSEVIDDNKWKFIKWCWSPAKAARPRPSSDQIVRFTEMELAKHREKLSKC